MFFSQKYPEIMASIEEKLQKQVEERGLDFETVRKDVEDGLKYELEFYGIAGFGSSYALMRTPGPLFLSIRMFSGHAEEKPRPLAGKILPSYLSFLTMAGN